MTFRRPRVESPTGTVHVLIHGDTSCTLCGRHWYPPDWRVLKADAEETCRACHKSNADEGAAAKL